MNEDTYGLKTQYEKMFNEPWSALERRVRSNPRNRHIFDMFDEDEWQRIEEKRLAALPWWKKLLGRTE